jgi:translation initiation factor 1 (eIF-1/SUI1)
MVKDREIIIQGHLAAEVEKYLTVTYEIPNHLLNSQVLKGVKPKKK